MKCIQKRLVLLTSLCSIGLLLSLMLLISNLVNCNLDMPALFASLLLISILLVMFLIRQYGIYNFASLIIENKIMHIDVAVAKQTSDDISNNTLWIGGFEVFISCFGILFGSKVIKFNTEGISLKRVEIGHDFICIVYGKGEKNEIIRLLHGVLGKSELENIIERFRHETGIIPIMID